MGKKMGTPEIGGLKRKPFNPPNYCPCQIGNPAKKPIFLPKDPPWERKCCKNSGGNYS